MSYFLKDPEATLDFAFDWSPWLDGQTIMTSEWAVSPSEAGGIATANPVTTPKKTVVTLTGGVPGHVYQLRNRITLLDGRRDDRTMTVRVEAR